MDLIIVRHARPEKIENAEGPADPPLSPLGIQQAEAVAEFLSEEKIDQIVTSSMQRAYETALPLSKRIGIDPIPRDDLRESDHNNATYIPVEEMTLDSGPVQAYLNDPLTIFEGDYDGFRNRVVGAFDQIIQENAGKKVAVFCHGMVTSVYLQTLWNLEHPFLLQPDYTGITRVQASSNGYRTVRSINETGHVRNLIERPKFGKKS
ncbi:MAG: histidine phosphatase family protein [Actinomycetota bacterium]|nr:histidine phosphatase family protein [Actinomycetota bacterium]